MITKLNFASSIQKIGQTEDNISRAESYAHLESSGLKRYMILVDQSPIDVIYGERICSKNLNVFNMNGSHQSPHHWHIHPSIMSFEDQNILACAWFQEVYNNVINDLYN